MKSASPIGFAVLAAIEETAQGITSKEIKTNLFYCFIILILYTTLMNISNFLFLSFIPEYKNSNPCT